MKKGFTLIELLIVIGIIAVLMAIAIVAINPGRQFAKANNARRWSDVNTILNAVSQRIVDGRGTWTTDGTCTVSLPAALTNIGSGVADVNICPCLVPTYIGSMPVDPTVGDAVDTPPCTGTYSTGYKTCLGCMASGRVTVRAESATTPQSENGAAQPIEVTR